MIFDEEVELKRMAETASIILRDATGKVRRTFYSEAEREAIKKAALQIGVADENSEALLCEIIPLAVGAVWRISVQARGRTAHAQGRSKRLKEIAEKALALHKDLSGFDLELPPHFLTPDPSRMNASYILGEEVWAEDLDLLLRIGLMAKAKADDEIRQFKQSKTGNRPEMDKFIFAAFDAVKELGGKIRKTVGGPTEGFVRAIYEPVAAEVARIQKKKREQDASKGEIKIPGFDDASIPPLTGETVKKIVERWASNRAENSALTQKTLP
jgi:hypothetical protein